MKWHQFQWQHLKHCLLLISVSYWMSNKLLILIKFDLSVLERTSLEKEKDASFDNIKQCMCRVLSKLSWLHVILSGNIQVICIT